MLAEHKDPTQCERILEVLADGEWHTAFMFLSMGIPRYGARIWELKERGFQLEKRTRSRKHGNARRRTYDQWRWVRS